MSSFALIVAAHGADGDGAINERIQTLAGSAAALAGLDVGTAAFHRGAPRFSEVLDRLSAECAAVVPLMTGKGYYCATVLPRELRRNKRFNKMIVHRTNPVGTHPAIASLVESRAFRLLAEHGVPPGDTALAVVGHGTPRHQESRKATEQLAASLKRRGGFGQVIAAFLDEPPGVESIPHRANRPNILIEPFLIGTAYHAAVDIPRRIGLGRVESSAGRKAPAHGPQSSGFAERVRGCVNNRFVLCDSAVGSDDAILGLVIALAVEGRSALARRIAGAA